MSEVPSASTTEAVTTPRHVDLIGVLGKRHVFSILDKSGKPDENIQELQQTAGMDFPSRKALPFLDLLHVPRAVVYQHLFEAAKEKLDKRLQGLTDDKLIEMLSATIRYLGVAELKSLPISILKKLSHNVPLKYLNFIAKNCKKSFILDDIPVEVRQLVWHVDASTFVHITEEYSRKWLTNCTPNSEGKGQRIFEESILQICKYIATTSASVDSGTASGDKVAMSGPSADIAVNEVASALSSDARWCSLLRHVLVNLPREKIKALGKLRDMAWQLNNFLRESNLNPDNTQTIVSDRKQLASRLGVNNIGITSIYSYVADIKRVFVASHERSTVANMAQHATGGRHTSPRSRQSKQPATTTTSRSSSNRVPTFEEKLLGCWSRLSNLDRMKIFARPVTEDEAPGYFDIVKHPMDLSTIRSRVPGEQHKKNHNESENLVPYTSVGEFEADLKLMLDNCFLYNAPEHPILDEASKLWRSWLKNKPSVFGSEAGSSNLTLNTTPAIPPLLVPTTVPPPPRLVVKSALLTSSTEDPPPPRPLSPSPPAVAAQGDDHKAVVMDEKHSVKHEDEEKTASKPKPTVLSKSEEEAEKPPMKITIKLKKPTNNNNDSNNSIPLSSSSLKVILKKALDLIWRVESDAIVNGPLVGIFSSPITEDIAPNYLSIIKFPMDLSTLRKRIISNAYKTVQEFEKDLKLIFDNCREYNEPGNILSNIGDNLWDFWVANREAITRNPQIAFDALKPPKIVAENVSDDRDSSKKKKDSQNVKIKKESTKKTNTKSKIADIKEPTPPPPPSGLIGQKASPTGLIGRKKGADSVKFEDAIIPQQSNELLSKQKTSGGEKPQAKISKESSRYSGSESASKHPSSSTSPSPSGTGNSSLSKKESSSIKAPAQEPKATNLKLDKVLQKSLDFIWRVEGDAEINGSLAGMFSSPVTEEIAPGYFSYVKHPMDLSTMKKKIVSHSYQSVDQFAKDLKLIVENCKLYNEPESVFSNIAENLWTFWVANRVAIETNPDVTYEQLHPPAVVVEEEEGSEEPDRPWPELAPVPEKKLQIKESHLLHEALERAVEFLSTEDDSNLFATDVNIPGYTDIIKKPRSLNFINSRIVKYKSVEAFESDVRLMFKNCIKFNEPNKDYFFSDLAVKLWQSWLVNRKHILLDSEAAPSTTSTVKKSKDSSSSSASSSQSTSGQKRSRDTSSSKDTDTDGVSQKKSRNRRADRDAMALMEDEEEEFEMDVDQDNEDEEDDVDYGFLDDEETEHVVRKTKKARGVTKLGTSNMDLFDEESSEEEENYSHSKKKKMKKSSSSHGGKSQTGTKASSKKQASSGSSGNSSSGKRPPNRSHSSAKSTLPMMPLVPLHRLSSAKILKANAGPTPAAAPLTVTATGTVAIQPGATLAPPPSTVATAVAPVAPVAQALSGAEKLQFSRNMLRWSVALLRDSQLQVMFKQHLCDVLLSLERNPPGQNSHALKSLGGVLPFEDAKVEHCLWLCQAGVDASDGIYELKADAYLLREVMPFLMHFHLTLNTSANATPLPTSLVECEDILKTKLNLSLVSFGADKALGFVADVMLLLVSSKTLDKNKKSSLTY